MIFMAIFRFCAIAFFLGLWGTIAWEDWRRQRIKHDFLKIGLGGALGGYAALCLCTALGMSGKVQHFLYPAFYQTVAVHLVFCALASVMLWVLRIWPAGDAKLFIFLAFLYPLLSLQASFFAEKLFLVFLINIFVPASVFLFFRAGVYIFDTRFRHFRGFLVQLGWRRELEYYYQQSAAALLALKPALEARIAAWRVKLGALDFRGWVEFLRARLAPLPPLLLQWLMGMGMMALVSYYLQDIFHSSLLLCLLCMAMFVMWNQVRQAIGLTPSRLLLGAALICLFTFKPPTQWARLVLIFGNISVFSFFMFLGMRWSLRMISGGWASIAAFVFPFVLSALIYVVAGFFRLIWEAAVWSVRQAGSLGHFAHDIPRPAVNPTIFSPLVFGAKAFYLGFFPSFSRFGFLFDTLVPMALLGLFFGLSLVLVRRWDDEVRPSHTRDALASRLLVAPSFLDRVRAEDGEFFEEHFQRVYPDGLTGDQAEALKAWCAGKGIDLVPLAPTMSFAYWIFLGFFMSLILSNGHVLQVLF